MTIPLMSAPEAEVRAILSDAMLPAPPPLVRAPRHVNFDLIDRTKLGEVVFEPMNPSLQALAL